MFCQGFPALQSQVTEKYPAPRESGCEILRTAVQGIGLASGTEQYKSGAGLCRPPSGQNGLCLEEREALFGSGNGLKFC